MKNNVFIYAKEERKNISNQEWKIMFLYKQKIAINHSIKLKKLKRLELQMNMVQDN